jgi:tetratricopeptide (TPR) repeat protein
LVINAQRQRAAVLVPAALAAFLLLTAARAETPPRNVEAAIPSLEQTFLAHPENYVNGWNLALAYVETGRLEKAHAQIGLLLKKHNTAELHNLYALTKEKLSHPEQAALEYETAARMEPSEKHLNDWGAFLLRRAAPDASLQIYRKAIELHPKSAALRIGLGLAHHARGEYNEAIESVCAAVDLDPNDPRPILFLGSLLDTSPTLGPQIARRLENFVRLYPNNAQAQLYYGLSLWKEPERQSLPVDAAKVEKHLAAAAKLDPDSFEAWLQLGILYERSGRDSEVIRVLQQAARLRPTSEAVHYRLGRAYQRVGRNADAEREFELYRRFRRPPKK